jgi:hypothetical protein
MRDPFVRAALAANAFLRVVREGVAEPLFTAAVAA